MLHVWGSLCPLLQLAAAAAFSVLVLLVARNSASCTPTSEEALILMEFKHAVIDPFNHLSTWHQQASNLTCSNSSSTSSTANSSCAAAWSGVVCGRLHGRVIELDLQGMGLQGSISASLGQLRFLRTLNLSSNNFSNSIPPQLSNCTHLETIDLSLNYILNGSIPTELGNLKNLLLLDLQYNSFTGLIPSTLANSSALEFVFLDYNQLSGRIPPELGRLKALQWLTLWENYGLTGSIPATLANCSGLSYLMLTSNRLSGSIPPELGMLKNLQHLYLDDNILVGDIPVVLANCSSLTNLDLHLNGLSGNIPPQLGMLNVLQGLSLWSNNLTGDIPATLRNCSALQSLLLDLNQLSKGIPGELAMLNQMWWFSLHQNHFTGDVPATLGNCSALQHLDLGVNQLSGNIPPQLDMLNSLTWVSLTNNRLTGNVPANLANWTALQYLDLAANELTGNLQFLDKFPNLTGLYALGLGANNFQGEVPDVFDRFSSLQKLGLWQNSLGGTLPRSLGSLKALTHVLLEGNMFQGSIPDAFLTSLQLQTLGLASNNLSGVIPASLGALSGLLALDLSHNLLSGPIPPELGSLVQVQYLDFSNNNLSGNIPTGLSDCVALVVLNLAGNHLSGVMPSSLGNLQSLTLLDLSYNEFTGLVPNLAPFNNTNVTNLTGNIGLCGQVVNRVCETNPPSGLSTDRRFNRTPIFIAVGVVVAVLGAAMIALGAIWLFRRCSKTKIVDGVEDFQLTSVLKLAGTELNVTADDLRKATGCFSEENVLGKGSVGTVYRAIFPEGKLAVAVKLLNNEMALAAEANFRREIEMLAKVRHKNVLRVLGCCFNLDMKAVILELMPNGSLDKYLDGRLELSGQQKLNILQGVAQGLEYLHHRHPEGSIVHCDIKPENILLDADFEARIADFGIAKLLNGRNIEESATILLRASVGYIAPEYGFKPNPSPKGDVYSFGVVMLEVLSGKRPTCNEILEEGHTFLSWVKIAIPEKGFNHIGISPDVALRLFDLALLCTHDSPIDRPTMLHICHTLTDLNRLENALQPHTSLTS